MWPYIATLLPSIGLLFLFYVVMKHIFEADRRERIANSEWERSHPGEDELSSAPSQTNSEPH